MFEAQKESVGYSFATRLEHEYSRKQLFAIFLFAFSGNLLSWIVAIAMPDDVSGWFGLAFDISDSFLKFLLLLPLSLAFTMAFTALRMRTAPLDLSSLDDDDAFSRYRDSQNKERLRNIILISGAFAGLNVILLVSTVVLLRN